MRRSLKTPVSKRHALLPASALAIVGCTSLAGLTGGDPDSGNPSDAAHADASHLEDAKSPSDGSSKKDALMAAHGDGAVEAAHDATKTDAACTTCSGECVNTSTDLQNCGGCGIVCKLCTNGFCLNYMDEGNTYPPPPDGGVTPNQTIAGVVPFSPLVYWIGASNTPANPADNVLIGNNPSASSQPNPYQEEVFLPFSAPPLSVTADSQHIFIGGTGYIATFAAPTTVVLTDAGTAELTSGIVYIDAGTTNTATSIAVDDTNLYWADSDSTSTSPVLQMPKGGGTVITLAPFQYGVTGLAVDMTSVYWIASHAVWRTAIGNGGGAPTSLTSVDPNPSGPTPLLVYGDALFWADEGLGSVETMLSSGGTPQTFAAEQPNVTALATDGTSLYWTTSTTTGAAVAMKPLAGGATTTVATLAQSGVTMPGGLALSNKSGATSVYGVLQLPETPPPNVLFQVTPPP